MKAPATGDDPAARERHDRRRANAAAALVLLGRHDSGLRLLKAAADPQARSFLIHGLGPAGAEPAALLDRLESEPDSSIRLALIQALGEIPASSWGSPSVKERAIAAARSLYRDDPHPGVHGSCRWLLGHWGCLGDIQAIDESLKGQARPGFGWRVGRSGLTFVRIAGPDPRRPIEVSATEVPRDLFLRLLPKHEYIDWASPEPDCPMTSVSYLAGAEFCNRLSEMEQIPTPHHCYRKGADLPIGPFPGSADLGGFRLPTEREFEFACRAGTITRRHFGDSGTLLPYYAWYLRDEESQSRSQPVARLKPNDFGLFDTLGNVNDLCQVADSPHDGRNQAIWCGGSYLNAGPAMTSTERIGPVAVHQTAAIYGIGLRVARTIGED